MTIWKQVSGDIDFSGTGCVLARNNPKSRNVDLVRIMPWLEMDSSALRDGHEFWCVDTTTIDYDDMDVEKNEVQDALIYVGLDADSYQALDPSNQAAVIADHAGYDNDSRSTSNFAKALPAPIDQVEFWSGSKKHDIESINDEMRHAVTYELYGGKFSSRKLPTSKALMLAFGDKPRTFELTDDEAQAIRYATAAFSNYDWPAPRADDRTLIITDWQKLASLLEVLILAPNSADLPTGALARLQVTYEGTYKLDWEDKLEQVAYLIDEDAKEARLLIDNLLGNLGF